jgi:hypothetical protein
MANRPQDMRHKLAIDAGDVLAFCGRASPFSANSLSEDATSWRRRSASVMLTTWSILVAHSE